MAQAQLISCPIDSKLARSLTETQTLLARHPEILAAVAADQDRRALGRKATRVADRQTRKATTAPLPDLDLPAPAPSPAPEIDKLGIGRPRIRPEAVCYFLVMRGHFGSLSGTNWDLASDSTTARHFLSGR